MHIDQFEKQQAIEEALTISQLLAKQGNEEKKRAFFKVFANYILKTSPEALNDEKLKIFDNHNYEYNKEEIEKLLLHIVKVGAEELDYGKSYRTSDLAKFFGVSVQTIHNWIEQGRFIGIEKPEKFKHVRISENVVYVSPSGGRIPIHQIAKTYQEEQKNTPIRKLSKAEEIKEIVDTIVFYEKKYGGPYEDTLGVKEELATMESRDAHEWRYLIKLLEGTHE